VRGAAGVKSPANVQPAWSSPLTHGPGTRTLQDVSATVHTVRRMRRRLRVIAARQTVGLRVGLAL